VYCTYDEIHVLKNIKHLLANNETIILSDVVATYELPSDVVEMSHLRKLVEFQEKLSWKPAPFLKAGDLEKKHLNKMKVAPAKHVFNRTTAAALEFLSELSDGNPGMKTTAFFVRLVALWSSICAARHPSVAPEKFKEGALEETFEVLHLTKTVFLFWNESGESGIQRWKLAHTGLIHCTTTTENLIEEFVVEKNDLYLLTGRVTQDFVENENSQVRLKHPTPTPLLTKSILKKRAFSNLQFVGVLRTGGRRLI